MLEFMDHVQAAFYTTAGWNIDNSYASLTSTAHNLLDFDLPQGIRLHLSSLSAPNFATSYTLGNQGVVNGSLSFLYSNIGLKVATQNSYGYLSRMVKGYRHLQELKAYEQSYATGNAGPKKSLLDRRNTLLYGRLYLPGSSLEALFLRRLSPTRLLRLNCVSDAALPNGGTLLATLHNDLGKYSTEWLYSTDSSLLGFRGLYNFGYDPRLPPSPTTATTTPSQPSDGYTARHPWDHRNGRLSAGGEIYFSPVNKSGGVSTGLRFTTLPVHPGFPYTMALTVNPLMGNLGATYAVRAGPDLALCSRFDFNVYSYESAVDVGIELWRRGGVDGSRLVVEEAAWAKRLLRPGWEVVQASTGPGEEVREVGDGGGVLKARVNNRGQVGFLWECKVKELLLSLGAGLDLKNRERMLGRVGVEVSYAS